HDASHAPGGDARRPGEGRGAVAREGLAEGGQVRGPLYEAGSPGAASQPLRRGGAAVRRREADRVGDDAAIPAGSYGYVEQEFFFAGTATAYDWAAPPSENGLRPGTNRARES